MKHFASLASACIFLLFFLLSSEAYSSITVQRTLNSSVERFNQYIASVQGKSFVEAYTEMSEKLAPASISVESCLEQVFLGRPEPEDCMKSVKALSSHPLNTDSREILFALLRKIEKSKNMETFKKMKLGLGETHPELWQSDAATKKVLAKSTPFLNLEWRAWKSAIQKKLSFKDSKLFINGKPVSLFAPSISTSGVYQWSLISNTHRPFILISTFAKFAADSLQNLTPFAESCRSLDDYEIQSLGLLDVQVFAGPQCIAKERRDLSPSASHLGDVKDVPKASSFHAKSWIWPVVALVGIGIASSLKGKQVQVTWPGSN